MFYRFLKTTNIDGYAAKCPLRLVHTGDNLSPVWTRL